jgi:hypothetical protein
MASGLSFQTCLDWWLTSSLSVMAIDCFPERKV